ncbi:MAG TPA: hypothetical protein PLU80_15645, partial [Acidobacteriota bacterium]|nr:hypothetical protein [Acidobacteriota bacterium]
MTEGKDQKTRRNVTKLTPEQISWLMEAAIARWIAAGASVEKIDQLRAVKFGVADLTKGDLLTETPSNLVLLDAKAAGYGWYIDPAPMDDVEFEKIISETELEASQSSPAHGKVDLLTVIMHQFGRALGLEVLDGEDQAHELMSGRMAVGVRRLPSRGQGTGDRGQVTEAGQLIGILSGWGRDDGFSNGFKFVSLYNAGFRVQGAGVEKPGLRESGVQVVTASHWMGSGDRKEHSTENINSPTWNPEPGTRNPEPEVFNPEPGTRNPEPGLFRSGETVNSSIGTIPAGKSVTVRFDVTIDNPPAAGTAQVCNQGTVSGSNFSNVVTDDPDVAGAANATCTALDAANLAVTKSDSPDPVVAGSNITYT